MLISIQKYFLFLLNGGDTNQEYYCLQFYGSIWFVYQINWYKVIFTKYKTSFE